MTDSMQTYDRDDRGSLKDAVEWLGKEIDKLGVEGLDLVFVMAETMLIAETYGLSVVFHDDALEWEAYDPAKTFVGRGNTLAAAIYVWDEKRLRVVAAPSPGHESGAT